MVLKIISINKNAEQLDLLNKAPESTNCYNSLRKIFVSIYNRKLHYILSLPTLNTCRSKHIQMTIHSILSQNSKKKLNTHQQYNGN